MSDKRAPARICTIPDCDRVHYARGFCKLHYERDRMADPEYADRKRARKRQWDQDHREAVNAGRRSPKYRSWSATYQRKRYAADPEFRAKKIASAREWWDVNGSEPETKARKKARMSKLYAANPERFADYQRRYLADPDNRARRNSTRNVWRRKRYASDPNFRADHIAKSLERYALKRGARDAGERFSLDEIFERDAARCHLCGKRVARSDASMDHIIPVSLGGEHSRANVALAHLSCNCAKGNRAVGEQLRLVG